MSTHHGSDGHVVALVEDVYFMAIISASASRTGTNVMFVRDGHEIAGDPGGILVDLQYRADWPRLVDPFRSSDIPVIGFGPHLDGNLMKQARQFGCTRVMAKSKFAKDIDSILRSLQIQRGGAAGSRRSEPSGLT